MSAPHVKPEQQTERLAMLIARKHQGLAQLRDLGRLQLQLIENEAINDLLRLLSGKQRILAMLAEVESDLDAFRDEAPEARRWPCEAEREKCAALADDCRRLLVEIVDQEKTSEQRMIVFRDQAGAQLEGAHAASAARGAYTDDGPQPCSQLDLLSHS